jgi:RNA polymerase sigma-70 factor (ECF subfamily)
VTLNKWRERLRRAAPTVAGLDAVGDVPASDGEAFWEGEYRNALVARALEIMRTDFQRTTWQACWEVVVRGRPVPEVAAELGLRPGAVHAARFRVLARLREELDGLLD